MSTPTFPTATWQELTEERVLGLAETGGSLDCGDNSISMNEGWFRIESNSTDGFTEVPASDFMKAKNTAFYGVLRNGDRP